MAPFAEGVPCWADAMLPDLEAGKRFYGGLFGWTFGPSEERFGRYTEARLDGGAVAALVPKTDGRMPTAWGIYLATADAAAVAGKVREAGGQVITGPMAVGDLGVMGQAADPGGAVFGFWQAGEHAGFAHQGRPGSYAWMEMYTRDKEAVDPFYERVFGYGIEDIDTGDDLEFAIWSPAGKPANEETAVGGRCVMDSRFPAEMPPYFLVYFAVGDCDEAVRTVSRLGGRCVFGPMDTPYGRIATVVDDQGASFAVIALTEPEAGPEA
ncbi:VOC family protein [Streptomyces xinghaiensis]|uniref:VOC family protein n=1 Tax=Streptomyces xinghaiensis TaxID=1038928 RepID=UPI0003161CE3|nr:VOC family protein [Streptomyces xinghaiensis]MZE81456.1 VOC family protein [Streptomyces sp. SID5475]